MHIKLTNGTPENYSIGQLRRDNSQVSFPKSIPDALLAEYNVFPLKAVERTACDPAIQRIQEGAPVMQRIRNPDGTFVPDNPETLQSEAWEWVQAWDVIALTEEEVAQLATDQSTSVREQRNQRLAESDWTQVADAPVDQAAWATYRQALRDITAQTGFPFELQWPEQP